MSNAMKGKQVIFIHGVYGKTDELFFFFFLSYHLCQPTMKYLLLRFFSHIVQRNNYIYHNTTGFLTRLLQTSCREPGFIIVIYFEFHTSKKE